MEEKKVRSTASSLHPHLESAKKHALLCLLDYADALKTGSGEEGKRVLESMKKMIHNTIGRYHLDATMLVQIASNGGEIPPLGN